MQSSMSLLRRIEKLLNFSLFKPSLISPLRALVNVDFYIFYISCLFHLCLEVCLSFVDIAITVSLDFSIVCLSFLSAFSPPSPVHVYYTLGDGVSIRDLFSCFVSIGL